MIDALRPWVGLGVGFFLMVQGARWALRPERQLGKGPIPASDPRTVRCFGIGLIVLGILNAGINIPPTLAE